MKLRVLLKDSVVLAQASARIRELARSGASIRLNYRVRQTMTNLNINETDILTILKKCRVIKPLGGGVGEDFHYRVEGTTVDEKGVALTIRIEEPPNSPDQLAVISIRWIDGGSHEQMPKLQVVVKKKNR